VLVLAAIVLPAAGFGYVITTFLFAFSGGQYRMVQVVGIGAMAVIAVNVLVAVVAWRLRSPGAAIKWTAAAVGASWAVALIAEWLLSFSLGAS
jgi:hypothetical protein